MESLVIPKPQCLSYHKVSISKYMAVVDIVATLCVLEALKKSPLRRKGQRGHTESTATGD